MSTDSKEIAHYATTQGAEVPYLRPSFLANDTALSIDVIKEIIFKLRIDGSICLAQPTSPLTSVEDVINAIEVHKKTMRPVVTVNKSKMRMSTQGVIMADGTFERVKGENITRRQDESEWYQLNGALFIGRTNEILEAESMVLNNCLGYEMPAERSVDIDDMLDWKLAEILTHEKRGRDRG